MDVYYMSDSIQYGSFRNPLYRDYEKFPYGTLENTLNSPPKSSGGVQKQQSQYRNQNHAVAGQGKSGKGKSSKDSCPFCKEQKKRPLGAYMRKRGQRITHESISEDAEECAEERQLEEEDEGTESQDDTCTSSPSGSPSAAELADGHHHHEHDGRRHGTSRQESQDSGCEAKWDVYLFFFALIHRGLYNQKYLVRFKILEFKNFPLC